MGEPWQLVPNADRCVRCEAEPENGLCPSCGAPVPLPVSRLWPAAYLGTLAAALALLLPYLAKRITATHPLIFALMSVMAAVVCCSVACVVYFIYTVLRGKDKRILLHFTLSNLAAFVLCSVLLVLAALLL